MRKMITERKKAVNKYLHEGKKLGRSTNREKLVIVLNEKTIYKH